MCILMMTFGHGHMLGVTTPHEDLVVLELKIACTLVRRIPMDTGSYANIITH